VAPLALREWVSATGRRSMGQVEFICALVLLAVSTGMLWRLSPRYQRLLPSLKFPQARVAEELAPLTGPDELVLSPTFEIPNMPPQLLALSRKRVYEVSDASAALRKIGSVASHEFRVAFLYPTQAKCRPPSWLGGPLKRVGTPNLVLFSGSVDQVTDALATRPKGQDGLCGGGSKLGSASP